MSTGNLDQKTRKDNRNATQLSHLVGCGHSLSGSTVPEKEAVNWPTIYYTPKSDPCPAMLNNWALDVDSLKSTGCTWLRAPNQTGG